MPLPKIKHPLYTLEMPSTGKKVQYRPFTVREEKIMLIAQETKEVEQAIMSIKQVLNNCLIDCDVDKLAMFDFEYVLLMLRSKSVDNTVKFSIKDPDTNEDVALELNLEEIQITHTEGHTSRIPVNEELTLFMRYPTINEFIILAKSGGEDREAEYEILLNCMEKVATQDEVYNFKDFSDEEISEFINDMTGDMHVALKKFFDTMPKLRHEVKYKNSNDDSKTFVIEGIKTFFI